MKGKGRIINLISLICVLIAVTLYSLWLINRLNEEDEEYDTFVSKDQDIFDYSPHTKADGSKYSFAYVDYDEYMPASSQFYYILVGLEERGWIKKDSLPFTIEEIEQHEMSTKMMYSALEKADLGDYIKVCPGGFHYLYNEKEEDIAADLKSKAGSEIDMVITFGTSAGILVKDMNLPIPMVDFSATDPVASGIIASSTEGSGNPNVWAQVEPSLPLRQLKYYYSVSPFKKLGVIVHGDEISAGIPDVELCSELIGFELVKDVYPVQPRETEEDIKAYNAMLMERFQAMADSGIDAFLLAGDVISDSSLLMTFFEPLYSRKIPVYMIDDASYVKKGATMLISAYDNKNVGRFVADTIVKIFKGNEAGKLPCIYTSSPSIYYNYDIGKMIDYPSRFEFLAVCDEIYTGGSGS
ncbi:MAG: hypothetical protein J6M24_04180 [Lachnospiraceae bacterium]|nr:hypothetical protein [Lachnospiraceae bacterium]